MLCPALGWVFSCGGVWAAHEVVTQVQPCGCENECGFLQRLLQCVITESQWQLYSMGSLCRVMIRLFCK